MGTEKDFTFYDDMYKSGGWKGMYHREAQELPVYMINWKAAHQYIIENQIKEVHDLGCGVGHFASLFSQEDEVRYFGYDFSQEAIFRAQQRNAKNANATFYAVDLKDQFLPTSFFTAFEFLEHISFDLEVIENIPIGCKILFSVPNYDSEGHVRYFNSVKEIESRYGHLLRLEFMQESKSPSGKAIFLMKGTRYDK